MEEIIPNKAATELLRGQDALQAEAHRLLADLDLMAVLRRVGQPTIVGSLALGLMVWRDIDIEVQCPHLNSDLAFTAVRPLVSRPEVFRLTYRDWTGQRAVSEYPEGYYWGVRHGPLGDEEWKLDIWLLPAGNTRRTGSALVESLPGRLTAETRLSILQIKDIWRRLPTYRDQVVSADIYDAVLEHGVRTSAEFDHYLSEHGRSVR